MSDDSCPQKCALDSGSGAVLPLLKLRIVCEPKGLPFIVSSMTTSFEMPGQVRGAVVAEDNLFAVPGAADRGLHELT
jgi:hypothetical protein